MIDKHPNTKLVIIDPVSAYTARIERNPPWWLTADSFELCVACDRAAKARERRSMLGDEGASERRSC